MRTLPAILLSLLVAFPLFADLPVAAPELRPATGTQSFPVLATSGTDALAAWRDERATPVPANPASTVPEREVYAAHISADGNPGRDFDVTPSVEEDVAPAVVWNGDEYVVAHLMSARFGFDGGIRFTRVKPDDAGDNRLIPRAEYASAPQFGLFGMLSLAWNGDEYLAVMSSQFAGDGSSIWGLLVDRSFHPIGTAFPLATGQTSQASAASDGNGFLVTWIDDRRIATATVSPSGAVAAQPLLSEAPTGGFFTSGPAIVWNGQRYFITWTDPVIRARFVERDGTPSSPVLDLFGAGRDTAVAWNGSEYLVPFLTEGDRNDIYALRLDAAGTVLGAPFPIAASDTSQASPAVVAIGSRFLVAWTDVDAIRSTMVDGTSPQAEAVVSRSIGTQFGPRGVFDGTNFAFTWQEEGKVYLSRVTLDGDLLDGGGIPLGNGSSPMIATNGEQYAVAFILPDGTTSGLRRVSRNGELLDAAPIAVPRVMDITTDGRDFLILSVPPPLPGRIRPAIFTAQGEVLPQPVIDDLPFDSSNPAAAWTGSHYALVYTQATEPFCYKCNQKYELHTLLLDRTGKPISPIRTITASQSFPFAYQVAKIASGGGATLAVFGGGSGGTVARIAEDGTPTLAPTVPDLFYPSAIVWTGSDFVVSTLSRDSALRLAPDGSLLQRFAIGEPDGSAPTLVPGAPRLTVTYDRPQRIEGQGTIRRAFFDFVQDHRRRVTR